MGKKRLSSAVESGENEVDLPTKFLKTSHGRMNEKRLIVILDGAQLEIVKVIIPRYSPHPSHLTNLLCPGEKLL